VEKWKRIGMRITKKSGREKQRRIKISKTKKDRDYWNKEWSRVEKWRKAAIGKQGRIEIGTAKKNRDQRNKEWSRLEKWTRKTGIRKTKKDWNDKERLRPEKQRRIRIRITKRDQDQKNPEESRLAR
jgi:hypothetical protein